MNLGDLNPVTALLGKAGDLLMKYFPDEQTRKQFEADLGARATELALQGEKIAADDRASARERQAKVGDHTPQILAYVYTLGFFAVLGAQFYCAVAGVKIPDQILRTLDITTGILFAVVIASKDYFLGSSKGSADKDAHIRHMWDSSP